jgi:hypothetical protein
MLIMKNISLLVLGILTSILSFSQTAKIGLKAGLNVANIKWENVDNTDSRIGANVGLLAHIHLTPEWALQPEVYYSQEGGKMPVGNDEVTWKTDYINIPLLLQYNFDNGFRLQAGPQLGLLVNAKAEANDGEESADEVFKSTNVSLGFGLGYLTYSGFGIDARYNLGLSKINEAGYSDAKGRVLQIGLFYMFDKNHKAKSR